MYELDGRVGVTPILQLCLFLTTYTSNNVASAPCVCVCVYTYAYTVHLYVLYFFLLFGKLLVAVTLIYAYW